MTAPMTREERQAVLIGASGGLEVFAAYIAANAALRVLSGYFPHMLGWDIADVYKDMTQRLDDALGAEEERRRS